MVSNNFGYINFIADMENSSCDNGVNCGNITENSNRSIINYLSNISSTRDENLYILPWNNKIILRDCDIDGNLHDLRQSKESFKKGRLNPWVMLTMKPFIEEGKVFPCFVCSICPGMQGILSLGTKQNEHELSHKMCYHSKVASLLIRDWREQFKIPNNVEEIRESYITDEADNVSILKEKVGCTLKSQWLVAVLHDKMVSYLFTVGKQSTPTCSKCSSRKCTCYWLFKNHQKHLEDTINANIDNTELGADTSIPNNSTSENSQTNETKPSSHYNETIGEKYGHNKEPILFPFKRCPKQKKMWEEKESKSIEFPNILSPSYDDDRVCAHGFKYNEDDSVMGICAQTMIIYTENSEITHPTILKYRRSVGPCSCQQHYDGHEYLLWHLGNGRMIDYKLLHNFFHDWIRTGIPVKAKHSSIISGAISMGRTSTLTYDMLLRAIDGFVTNLSFDIQKCFICPRCGKTPRYFIGDGTKTGPLKSKIKASNIHELGNHEDDKQFLSQGSKFSDRVFLSIKKERDEVLQLLSGNISMSDFIDSTVIKSENFFVTYQNQVL